MPPFYPKMSLMYLNDAHFYVNHAFILNKVEVVYCHHMYNLPRDPGILANCMRVGLFTDFYVPHLGGVETAVMNYVRALQLLGHEVTVVCPTYKNYDKHESGTLRLKSIKPLKPNSHPLITLGAKNKAVIDQQVFDIVHVQTDQGAAFWGAWYAKQHKVPFFKTVHTNDLAWMTYNYGLTAKYFFAAATRINSIQQRKRMGLPRPKPLAMQPKKVYDEWLLKKIFSHTHLARAIITPSQHFMELLQQYCPDQTYVVVPNAVDIDAFKPEFESKAEPVRIIWVGRASAEKRPMVFLEAVFLLKHKTTQAFVVDVIGDGPELSAMRKFVARHKLDCVTLHGGLSQESCKTFWGKADICAFTSYHFDTQGIVLAEAAASGIPVVLCDEKLVSPDTAAGHFLAAGPSAQDLALEFIKALHKKTPKSSQPIRKFAKDNYSLGVLAKRLEGVYRQA